MGTRCDFWVGRGLKAEWLGSVAWDGMPENFPDVIACADEQSYRALVQATLIREDGTFPDKGWPWPWEDSRTTDFAVAFDGGDVFASCFGGAWYDPEHTPRNEDGTEMDLSDYDKGRKTAIFPNMKHVQKVTFGKRSGVMLVGPTGPVEPED